MNKNGNSNAIINQQLKNLGDMAMRLKSDLTPIKSGRIKYIFSHPEDILSNRNFNDYISSESFRKRNINVYVVVDEAHCILEWGEELIREFNKLAQIRSVMKCRFFALSSNVTERGQKEISDKLLMTDCKFIGASPAKEKITPVSRRPSPNSKRTVLKQHTVTFSVQY
ncbi:hypothetical protein DPMN_045664 [Dreissena polymorpha]|uniref:Helicase ATP-binding domain-containing protein n=1 Tax=Dreissena polymorpha TaxID=45954 RepID=A0A9D4D5G0_DREPO|nr:hypothetical protein DPMN_045664 [Dreissena polymorpha]